MDCKDGSDGNKCKISKHHNSHIYELDYSYTVCVNQDNIS